MEIPIQSNYTHAGGIVWKMVENESQFLIVTAKSNPSHWVLPKGHIEKGERMEETSVREVREETGVDARVVATVGSTKYETDKEFVHVKFYLMEYLKEQEHGKHEGRKSKWCTFNEAVNLLTFSDTKQLLQLAKYRLEKVLGNKSE
jgi:8-oxo-dGTP pyrophosphatase MutT (NUDIX family)